ncbi:uncharacterized protein PITG_06613 [Phytophthora infestans T30-4]|uniref:Uncharacterized protein n=1 Tax=Phytophthora infestans (strain T30-4) TaxID=403677 RepID=D0N595_PHYIT|nr:uncharacterized protein PITG_06613 [Phytophthora infestans T30-4]EEY70053.1 hypothetical protein PITG_06613 [Phytophthora infestans T30-4]|eukprot:XP_002998700.1 hypothetical protein PITG_06613 [Phytophthora infestans T30-4]
MVADAEEPQRRDHVDSVSDAAKSPLLRMHFRTKLQSLATSDGRLQYTKWLEFALADSEMAQLMEWEMINRRSGGTLRLKTRSVSFWGVTPVQPALSRASSDSTLQLQQQHSSKRESNNFGVESAPFLKKSALVTEQGLVGRRHVTLLSRKMSKKFKACWPPDEADPLVRNPFKEPPEAASSGGPYVFWCQCTVS